MRERGPLFHEDKGEEIMYELIKKDGRAKPHDTLLSTQTLGISHQQGLATQALPPQRGTTNKTN